MTSLDITVRNVDGLQVLSIGQTGAVKATLQFRVGHGDEPMHQRGLCTLIADLAVAGLDRKQLFFWVEVDHLNTSFVAWGLRAEVEEFLTRVSRWVANPDLHRLKRRARKLARAAKQAGPTWQETIASLRYGNTGAAAGMVNPYSFVNRDEDVVRSFVSTYFVRENAVLMTEGEIDETVCSSLQRGEAHQRPPGRMLRRKLPASYVQADSGVAFSIVHTTAPGHAFAWCVIDRRMKEALGDRATDSLEMVWLDAERSETTFVFDPAADGYTMAELSIDVQRVLHQLRAEPLTGEVELLRVLLAEDQDSPFYPSRLLRAHGIYRALGADPTALEASDKAVLAKLTDEELTANVREVLATLVLLTPSKPDSSLQLHPVRWTPDAAVEGETFHPSVLGKRGGAQALVIGDDAIYTKADVDGTNVAIAMKWVDVSVVERHGRMLLLVDWRGRSIALDPAQWRKGRRATACVRSCVPAKLSVRAVKPLVTTRGPRITMTNSLIFTIPLALALLTFAPWQLCVIVGLVLALAFVQERWVMPIVRRNLGTNDV